MPTSERQQLYRGRDGVIGGVCSGIARLFDLDVSVVRLLTVVLTVLTSGVLAAIYALLWLVLPLQPIDDGPLNVAPEGATTTSPIPPVSSDASQSAESKTHTTPVTIALLAGFTLITVGVGLALSAWWPGHSLFQFWPLVVILCGIARMVLPGPKGFSIDAFVMGLCLTALGILLLLRTLDIVSIDLCRWMADASCLLFIAAGCFFLARAFRMPVLSFVAGVAVVCFCVMGVTLYASDAHFDKLAGSWQEAEPPELDNLVDDLENAADDLSDAADDVRRNLEREFGR